MSTPSHFSEYYKQLSNTELLKILDEPADYLPEAIAAATAELTQRRLSEEELKIARAPLSEIKQEQVKKDAVINAVKSGVRETTSSVFSLLDPFQVNIYDPQKQIGFITLSLGIIFGIALLRDFQLVLSNIYDFGFFTGTGLLCNLPWLLLLVGIIFFLMRKKIGWILLMICLVELFIMIGWTMLATFNRGNSPDTFLSEINKPEPLLNYGIQLLFLVLMAYAIGRKAMRNVFQISDGAAQKTIFFTGAITLIIAISLTI